MSRVTYKDGKLHSYGDCPAIVELNGTMRWYANGILHRESKDSWGYSMPAIIRHNGEMEWWVNGVQHRVDGPAELWEDGTHIWFYEGKVHRSNGPAIVLPDGTHFWYTYGKRNRTEYDEYGRRLPAVIRANGQLEWWENDRCIAAMSTR